MTYKQLQALLWGGPLEAYSHDPGTTHGWVLFQRPNGCDLYYDSTRDGVKIPGDDRVITVEKAACGEAIPDALQTYYSNFGATRCVRVTNLPARWTEGKMNQFGGGDGRKLEQIFTGTSQVTGVRFLWPLGLPLLPASTAKQRFEAK